jgi:hypothetical protein
VQQHSFYHNRISIVQSHLITPFIFYRGLGPSLNFGPFVHEHCSGPLASTVVTALANSQIAAIIRYREMWALIGFIRQPYDRRYPWVLIAED